MGTRKPLVFDPLDLEIIDRVFEVAWEQIKARDLSRDQSLDEEKKQALREMIFDLAPPGHVDFDTLCDLVLPNIPEPRTSPAPRGLPL
jgi:hypothetical protein